MEKNILNFYKKKDQNQASEVVSNSQEAENYGSINIFYAANDGGQGMPTLRQDSMIGKTQQGDTSPGTFTQPVDMGFLKQVQQEENTPTAEVSPELWTKEMVAEKLKALEQQSQKQEYDLFSNVSENKDKDNVIAFGALDKGEKTMKTMPMLLSKPEEPQETIAPMTEFQIPLMSMGASKIETAISEESKIGLMPMLHMAEKEEINEIPNIFEKAKEKPKEPLSNPNLNFSNLFNKNSGAEFPNLFKNSDQPNYFGDYSKTTEIEDESMEMTTMEDTLENETEESDMASFQISQEEPTLELEDLEEEEGFYALDQGIMSLETEESDTINFEEDLQSFDKLIEEPETSEIEEISMEFSESVDDTPQREKDYLDYYSDENAYTISNSYDDLKGFINACDDSALRKVTLSEPDDEKIILINGAFSKILLTDAFVMMEEGRVQEARALLEKICLTSLDAKIANRAFFKLEELKEKYDYLDMPIENTFYQCLKKEEQLIERLKKIY